MSDSADRGQEPPAAGAGSDGGEPRLEPLVLRAEADYVDPDAATRAILDDLPLRPGDRVLDLGCGAGQWAAGLAARVGWEGSVDALDPDSTVLTLAQELLLLHQPDLAGRVRFSTGGTESIPAEDATFDLVWLSLVLHHHAEVDRRATLREIRRVLRPGGWVAIRDGDSHVLEPVLPLPPRLSARLQMIFAEAESPADGFAALGGPRHLHVGRELPALLAEAGFERWSVRGYQHVYRHPLAEADRRVLASTLITGWRGRLLEQHLDPADWQHLRDLFTAGRPGSWLDEWDFHAFKPDLVYLAQRP